MPDFVPHAEDILNLRLAAIAADAREDIEPGFRERLAESSRMERRAFNLLPSLRFLGRYLLPLVGVVAAVDIVKQVADAAKNRAERERGEPGGGQHGVPPAFRDIQRYPDQFGNSPETDLKWEGKYSDEPVPIVNDPDLTSGDPTLSPSYMQQFGDRYEDALLQRGLGGFGTQPGSYGGTAPSASRLEESLRSSEPTVTRSSSETRRKLRRVVEAAAPASFSQGSGLSTAGDEGTPAALRGMVAMDGTQEQYSAQGYGMASPQSPFHGPAAGLGRDIQQGGFEYLPGRNLQMTNLLAQQAWIEGGGVEANAAVRNLWYVYNVINEQVSRGVITPQAGLRNLAMVKWQIEQQFGPEMAEQIYSMMDRATAGGFRGGLGPQSDRGEISIGEFDESDIPEWRPGEAGQYGLSPWSLQTQGRIGEGLAPLLGPGRSKLRRM